MSELIDIDHPPCYADLHALWRAATRVVLAQIPMATILDHESKDGTAAIAFVLF
jgi:hypothetical protein